MENIKLTPPLSEKYISNIEFQQHKLLAYALNNEIFLNNLDIHSRSRMAESLSEKYAINPEILTDYLKRTENIFILLSVNFKKFPIIEKAFSLLKEQKPDFFQQIKRDMLTDYEEKELYQNFLEQYYEIKDNPLFQEYIKTFKSLLLNYDLELSKHNPLFFEKSIQNNKAIVNGKLEGAFFLKELPEFYGEELPKVFNHMFKTETVGNKLFLNLFLPEIKKLFSLLKENLNPIIYDELLKKNITYYLIGTNTKVYFDQDDNSPRVDETFNYILELMNDNNINVDKTVILTQLEKDTQLEKKYTFTDLMMFKQNESDLNYFIDTGLLSLEELKNSAFKLRDKLTFAGQLFVFNNFKLTDEEKEKIFFNAAYAKVNINFDKINTTHIKDLLTEFKRFLPYFKKQNSELGYNFNHSFFRVINQSINPELKKELIAVIKEHFILNPTDIIGQALKDKGLTLSDPLITPLFDNVIKNLSIQKNLLDLNAFEFFEKTFPYSTEQQKIDFLSIIKNSIHPSDKKILSSLVIKFSAIYSLQVKDDFYTLISTILKAGFDLNEIIKNVNEQLIKTEGKNFVLFIKRIKPFMIENNIFIQPLQMKFAQSYQNKIENLSSDINNEITKLRMVELKSSFDGFNNALKGRMQHLLDK